MRCQPATMCLASRDRTQIVRRSVAVAALAIVPSRYVAAQTAIDANVASRYFSQLQQTSERDGGRTWGKPLYGPILFVDPASHQVVANQADTQGGLRPQNGVFIGVLPQEISPANTAIDWLGVHWTMVMWPVPEFRQPRERLLLHECFHRLQKELALPEKDAVNDHLDTRDGRIWLQMEWRALERALRTTGAARNEAVTDALLFRAYRRSLFPGAPERENALELNEGLAEYTGVKLSSVDLAEAALRADQILRQARSNYPTFARSFAYVSGPAYGTLLDLAEKPWRRGITSSTDLGRLLQNAYGVDPVASAPAAQASAARYQGDEIIASETRHEQQRQKQIADARQKFIDAPVLILPLSAQVNYSYDPTDLVGIDSMTTFYPSIRIVDDWGILSATGGALVFRDQSGHVVRAQVVAPPAASPLKSDAWSLQLKDGWAVVPADRAGDFSVKRGS